MIFKVGKKDKNNHRRRLEDQFGTQYTTIMEDVEIEGTLNTHYNVRIDGNHKGQINTSGIVWISKNAEIKGIINANDIIVEGFAHGNVHCTGKAELRCGARIKGDIACASLAVSKGCALEGKVEMREGRLQTFVAKRKMFENKWV